MCIWELEIAKELYMTAFVFVCEQERVCGGVHMYVYMHMCVCVPVSACADASQREKEREMYLSLKGHVFQLLTRTRYLPQCAL